MAKMFREGQRVICIQAPGRMEYQCKVGKVYTVLHDDNYGAIQLRGERGWYRRALFKSSEIIYLGGE